MSYKGRLTVDVCADLPFAELHEYYRIAYLKMEARIAAQKEEEKKRKQEEEAARIKERQESLRNRAHGPRKPWTPTDVKKSQTTTPPSSYVDENDLEELLEDGGLI